MSLASLQDPNTERCDRRRRGYTELQSTALQNSHLPVDETGSLSLSLSLSLYIYIYIWHPGKVVLT
jgi:hypothetical protein